jgi:3-hydroxypropanoate dehydrogenase
MTSKLSPESLDVLFHNARTHNAWRPEPVSDHTLRELWDLLKWGPTSANCSPMRVAFVKSPEAKELLRPTLMPGNVEKTMKAPVTAILAYDLRFAEHMPRLFPHNPQAASWFADPEFAKVAAFRNGSLQAGYFILAARSLGLDCGPMSGFDNAKLDEAFFPDGRYRSNLLVNLGYGDPQGLYPRAPRLSFDEACSIR